MCVCVYISVLALEFGFSFNFTLLFKRSDILSSNEWSHLFIYFIKRYQGVSVWVRIEFHS